MARRWNQSAPLVRFGSLTGLCLIALVLLMVKSSTHQESADTYGLLHDDSMESVLRKNNTHTARCRDIWKVKPHRQCAYAQIHCLDDEDSLISYISLYYCRLSDMQPFALLLLIAWMVFLFSALGIIAGDFLAVNLGSIAQALKMSDSLAGVTFLALGNGAPDIFSTIAAMNESSNNLALGELAGAAVFITAVVAGSMALLHPFEVDKIPLLRDATFLLITFAFLHYILHDGSLRLWHCVVLLAIYISYISVVVCYHWWRSHHAKTASHAVRPHDISIRRASVSNTEYDGLLPRRRSEVSKPGTSAGEEQHGYQSIHHSSEPQSNHHHVGAHTTFAGNFWTRFTTVCAKAHITSSLQTFGFIVMLPARILFHLTVPRVQEDNEEMSSTQSNENGDNVMESLKIEDGGSWNKWLSIVHCFTSPQMLVWFVCRQVSATNHEMFMSSMICLGLSVVLILMLLVTTSSTSNPRYYKLLCLPGFLVSIVWISSLADEMVAILGILGIICNISNAIMGITVFAIGNSIDDWAADLSVAGRGHPLMAFSACFGGPLLNILIGISIGGIRGILKSRAQKHGLGFIDLKPSRSLFFVSWSVMGNIVVLLLLMLWTRWRMTRIVGGLLVGVWVITTTVNVVLEMES